MEDKIYESLQNAKKIIIDRGKKEIINGKKVYPVVPIFLEVIDANRNRKILIDTRKKRNLKLTSIFRR